MAPPAALPTRSSPIRCNRVACPFAGARCKFTSPPRRSCRLRAGDVLRGIREKWLKLNIEHVLPLAQAAEAHRLLEGRQSVGKLLLSVASM